MALDEKGVRLYQSARREAAITILVWFVALLWTLGYCYLRGYEHPADSWLVTSGWATPPGKPVKTVLGVPEWIFYGIVVPWLVCTAFTVLFGLFGIRDDELGAAPDEEASHGA